MKQFTRAVVSAALCAALSLACTLPAFAAEGEMLEVNEDISVSADYDWTRFANDHLTLNVYNWGLYISDGSDDSVNVISAFEDLTGIKVNYTTFDSNESLYAKMKSGGASYDVIVPSDYMVGKMIAENMLAELDYDNIPNMATSARITSAGAMTLITLTVCRIPGAPPALFITPPWWKNRPHPGRTCGMWSTPVMC